MPLTNLQKAEAEQRAVLNTVIFIEERIALGEALTEDSIRNLLKMAMNAQARLIVIQENIHLAGPTDANASDTACRQAMQKCFTCPTAAATHDFRLPRLELPNFNGDMNEWISFRDMFLAAVDSRANLTKVEKLTYLKSVVGGEAARQIQNLSLTEANYDLAWKALNERYHNEREQIFSIMKKLFTQQQINPTSSGSIRTLVDTTKSCIRTFDLLKGDINHLYLYIIFTKLDSTTKEDWFHKHSATAMPNLDNMYSFLEQRALAVSASTTTKQSKAHAHHIQPSTKCSLCESPHRIYKCEQFLKLAIPQRSEHLKKSNHCFNCLQSGHSVSSCRSNFSCRTCGKKHHTLLHTSQFNNASNKNDDNKSNGSNPAMSHYGQIPSDVNSALLATAVIRVTGRGGAQHLCRALLDGGSSTSFITEACSKKLGLRVNPSSTEVVGLSASPVGSAVGVSSFVIAPHFQSNDNYTVTALVIPRVTTRLPTNSLSATEWNHLHDIELADPQFHTPGYVDILLGSDVFWTLLGNDKKLGLAGQPLAIKSTLGWLVAGQVQHKSVVNNFMIITNDQLNLQLERFWENESIQPHPNTDPIRTPDETKCENIFTSGYTRDVGGRFTVPIPWKNPRPQIGNSKAMALQRLKQMERRLWSTSNTNSTTCKKKQSHIQEYIKFMTEYETLGHMTKVPAAEISHPLNDVYYIPHHFVLKMDSTTTKFRVVFDGSAKSSTGISLNDAMLVGPTVQSTLYEILLRFRTFAVVFTADIEKMYRQILLTQQDSDLHRILWRENPSLPIEEYRLQTVTYGTAAAPFLATYCLLQLSKDEKERFPTAAPILEKGFYVDDLMSGTKTTIKAKQTVKELIEVCDSAGFPLRKWTSNDPEVLQSIPENIRETKQLVPVDQESTVKTLGIYWNPVQDCYLFKIHLPEDPTGHYTKRIILSEMSQLFDPLGWLAPVTINAKILMQEIWKTSIDWDTSLPEHIQQQWKAHKSTLCELERLVIPRYIYMKNHKQQHLVGFADASERAYAAVLYMYSTDSNGNSELTLITSKTRVAPVKSISLPRLELNAAVLLTEVVESVQSAYETKHPIQAFSDSTIVLSWIQTDPNRWKTYVRNRICKIQAIIPPSSWYHVPGKDNPADCASRGLLASDLINYQLWWRGNINIIKTNSSHQHTDFSLVEDEAKRQVSSFATVSGIDFRFIHYFSDLKRLLKFIALSLRAQSNFKVKRSGNGVLQTGTYSADDLNTALLELVKVVQGVEFSSEINLLQRGQELGSSNKLLPLNPFVGEDGLLRVGGRLRHSKLPHDQKHPLLLPRSHHLTKLIIENIHYQNLHSGPQQTLATFNQKFWITRAKDSIRYILKKCVVCERHKGKLLGQLMGDLPEARVSPSPPFEKCGVDYAGPFTLRNAGRSRITFKSYLSIFVCFVTRAIHIELTSSLSTEVFMAALRRFISRRGRPSDIFSDCGTNFIGAQKVLNSLFSGENQSIISGAAAEQGIRWHFNPPSAPHFGGLWEAGVRSVKYHLHRVIGNNPLTYEELNTFVVQIEGILNSRPLTAISTDPNELQALTPAHFLVGRPLTCIPEPDLQSINVGRLDRWQMIQAKQQTFWKRWSSEYVSRLQQRPKWMKSSRQLQPGDIVIIKEDNLPPAKWRLGRVIELFPGADKKIRVVELKTSNGTIKRPIHKLCLLPIFDE